MWARVCPTVILISAAIIAITPLRAVRAQVDQVTSLEGPFGSGAIRVVSHPDGDLIAISRSSVFRSVDEGRAWPERETGPEPPLRDLAVTGNGTLLLITETGAFRSTDQGRSWIPSGLEGTDVRRLAVRGESSVFAASYEAVYRSHDGGGTWIQANGDGLPEHSDIRKIVLSATPGGSLLMSIQLEILSATIGIYRSTDLGDTWERTQFDEQSEVTDITPSQDGMWIYAGMRDTRFVGPAGLFRSADDGQTWDRVREENIVGLHAGSEGDLLIGTEDGVYKSSDGGETLSHVGLGGTMVDQIYQGRTGIVLASTIRRCEPALDPPIICRGISALYRLEEGEEAVQVGLERAVVRSIAFDENRRLLAGTDAGIIPKMDGGWGAPLWSYGGVETIDVLHDGTILLASEDAGIWRLGDDYPLALGQNCDSFTCGGGFVFEDSKGRILASITLRIYGGNVGVVRSVDSMATWQLVLDADDIYAFAEGTGDTLYAGGGDAAFFQSVDGGVSWSPISGGLPEEVSIRALIVTADGLVLAGMSEGMYIFESEAGWREAGPAGVAAHALVRGPDGDLLAATDDGVLVGEPDAWEPAASTFDWPPSHSIAVNDDGIIYVGTTEGVFELRLDTDAVHDTLDWRGYFPLEVGNVWQYDVEVWQGSFGTIGEWIEQWEIVGDTTLDAIEYLHLEMTCDTLSSVYGLFDHSCNPGTTESHYLRYDDEAANILSRTTDENGLTPEELFLRFDFRLDAPFHSVQTVDGLVRYEYSPAESVSIANERVSATAKIVSVSDAVPGGFTFAHSIGLVSRAFSEGGGRHQSLRYVRIGDTVHGQFVPLDVSERPLAIDRVRLDLYPNPTAGEIRIELTTMKPGNAVLELFDVLGRRIRKIDLGFLPAGRHARNGSIADLSSGTYYVALKIGGAVGARTEIVLLQ